MHAHSRLHLCSPETRSGGLFRLREHFTEPSLEHRERKRAARERFYNISHGQ
jgi:hypothetical protein